LEVKKMGEASYYLLATFNSKEKAHKAYLCAKVILKDLAEFQKDWQKIRNKKGTAKEKFQKLLKRHPLVAKFVDLPEPPENDPAMNFLAGHCEITKEMELRYEGKQIKLFDVVWHCADWDNIGRLFYKLGASRVAWVSEEAIDPFELLEDHYEQENDVDELPEEVIRQELLPKALANEFFGG